MSTAAPLQKKLYTANATAFGGREGRVKTDDGKLDFTLSPPPGLGGKGEGTNPEQLFAAGYSACFGSAVAHRSAPVAGSRACTVLPAVR